MVLVLVGTRRIGRRSRPVRSHRFYLENPAGWAQADLVCDDTTRARVTENGTGGGIHEQRDVNADEVE